MMKLITENMDLLLKIFLVYLALVSFISWAVTIWDKRCAKKGTWRVPEKTLLIFSLLGGSLVMYVTMLKIRHKTKHAKFMVGIPAIMVLQLSAIGAVVYFLYFR